MADPQKHLLIVAHAPSPNTLRLRQAVAEGAHDDEISGVSVTVKPPLEAGPDDLRTADAIILGTTENLGSMSGALKDFFDRSYYPILEDKQGLPCAAYIRAGHDGTGTARQLQTILTGLKWRVVQEPVTFRGAWQEAFVDQARELGQAMAAGLEAGVF